MTGSIEVRLSLYQSIREAARQQQQALLGDNLQRFQDLLSHREELLKQVEAISDSENESAAGGVRSRAAIAEMIRDIVTIDADNQQVLAQKLARVAEDLSALGRGRQALRNYGHLVPQTGPLYVDRTG